MAAVAASVKGVAKATWASALEASDELPPAPRGWGCRDIFILALPWAMLPRGEGECGLDV